MRTPARSTLESCIRKINRESVIDGISEEICIAMNNGSTPALERLQIRLKDGIPHGTIKDLARRLGREYCWVASQIEGQHPLTGDVIFGCLHAMPEDAREEALSEWLDGLVNLDQRVALADALRRITAIAKEAEQLMEPA